MCFGVIIVANECRTHRNRTMKGTRKSQFRCNPNVSDCTPLVVLVVHAPPALCWNHGYARQKALN